MKHALKNNLIENQIKPFGQKPSGFSVFKDLIDNKLITIQTWSGYILERVVSLWYAQKNTRKCKERSSKYGKQTQTAR